MDLKGELNFDWIIKRTPISTDELQIDNSSFSAFVKFMFHNLYEEKEPYKIVRDNTIAKYNPTLITSEDENVFNERNHTIFRLDAHYSQTYLCAITK